MHGVKYDVRKKFRDGTAALSRWESIWLARDNIKLFILTADILLKYCSVVIL